MYNKERLDVHEKMPSGMDEYLSNYGWHFSKKLCDFAVSRMKKKNSSSGKEETITPITKEQVDELLKKYNVSIERKEGYDCVFVANMCKADYLGSSVPNEQYLALFIKDYVDDPDGYDGLPMTRWYADIIGSGTRVIWEDML